MFESHNAALWPLHVLIFAVGFFVLALGARRESASGRFIAPFAAAMLTLATRIGTTLNQRRLTPTT